MSQQLVVSNNSGKKLKENVKRDNRKLLKYLEKKQSKNKKTHTKQEHTHVKNFKKTTDDKGFLMEIKTIHVGNWNEWPLVLRT